MCGRGEEERLFCRFTGRGPVPHPKVTLGLAAAELYCTTSTPELGQKLHMCPRHFYLSV